jgi:hypothetical protein
VFSGGGISNAGILTILNTTLNGNSAARGGGIFNSNGATLILINNTVSGNRAGSDFVRGAGGGIDNVDGTVTISSTISGNSSVFCIPFPPFPRCGDSYGGGIASSGSVKIQNSIVANNTSGGNCYSTGTMTSKGYNMSSDGRCNFFSKGDWNNTDPMLGPLQNNRGPTWTMALQPGSPAIDAGNPLGCTDGQGHLLMTDQRGQPRPDKEDKTGCDIGAYERQSD